MIVIILTFACENHYNHYNNVYTVYTNKSCCSNYHHSNQNGSLKAFYPASFPFLQVAACQGDHPDNDYSADRTQMQIGYCYLPNRSYTQRSLKEAR